MITVASFDKDSHSVAHRSILRAFSAFVARNLEQNSSEILLRILLAFVSKGRGELQSDLLKQWSQASVDSLRPIKTHYCRLFLDNLRDGPLFVEDEITKLLKETR